MAAFVFPLGFFFLQGVNVVVFFCFDFFFFFFWGGGGVFTVHHVPFFLYT